MAWRQKGERPPHGLMTTQNVTIVLCRLVSLITEALHWRHNGHNGVSNHQSHDCLLNPLFRCRSQKTPKLRVTGLCEVNSPVTGEFPAQRASNAEKVSIWCRHHGFGAGNAQASHPHAHPYADTSWFNITMPSYEKHGVSNHRQLDCLSNSLFWLTSRT